MRKSVEKDKQDGLCGICLERELDTTLNGCSHGFCFTCITKWSNRNKNCPLCRKKMDLIIHDNGSILNAKSARRQRLCETSMNVPTLVWTHPDVSLRQVIDLDAISFKKAGNFMIGYKQWDKVQLCPQTNQLVQIQMQTLIVIPQAEFDITQKKSIQQTKERLEKEENWQK